MGYYKYHAILKKLLDTEPYEVIEETGKFSHRFIFPQIGKSMPIRDYREAEYIEYINI